MFISNTSILEYIYSGNLLFKLYYELIFFKATIWLKRVIAGVCIAGDLAVLAGVVRNIEVSARGELIATKNLAGYFLPHKGYNFTLKTSSIP